MKKNTAMKNRSRRGVALIFALGILGLMVALGLTFASLSFTEQTASRSSTDRYVAKLLARSAAERAIAVLEHNTDLKVKELVSGGESGALEKHYDFLWRMITNHGDVPGAAKMYKHIGTRIIKGEDSPYWQYVIAPNKSGNDEIIGRFAYMAYKPAGLLDPVATGMTEGGTKAKRLGCIADEIDLSALAGAAAGSKSLSASDIEALGSYNADPSKPETCNTPAELFQRFTSAANTNLTAGGDYAELADKLTASWFSIPRPSSQKEAFWHGSGDSRKLYHRFNINRTPDEWAELSVDQIMSPSNLKAYDDSVSGSLTATQKANLTTAIPWFFKDDDDTRQAAANFLAYFSPIPTTEAQLKDRGYWNYSTDPATATYTANMRTPYINEVVLDIRLNMNVEENYPDTSVSYRKTFTVTITPTVDVYIELADLYGSLSGITSLEFQMPLFKELSLSEKGGTSEAYSPSDLKTGLTDFTFEAVPGAVFNDESGTKKVYPVYKKSFSGSQAKLTLNVDVTVAPEGPKTYSPSSINYTESLEKFVLNKLHVLLSARFSGGGAGYLPTDLSNLTSEEKTFPNFGNGGTVFAGLDPFGFEIENAAITSGQKVQDRRIVLRYQAKDPCANLKTEDWVASDVKVSQSVTEELFSMTGTNNFKDLGLSAPSGYENAVSAKMDYEKDPSGTDSTEGYGGKVSTSFIRGRVSDTKAIRSPWEIGFIHRGRPYQTLNIKKFTDQDAIGDYDEGDAKIFEYLKFTPRGDTPMNLSGTGTHDAEEENWNRNRGLVNLNDVTAETENADEVAIDKGNLQAAKTLFKGVRRGMTVENLESDSLDEGTVLSDSDIEDIVTALAKLNIAVERLDYRSQIMSKGSSSGDAKEQAYHELHGKIVAPAAGRYDAGMEEVIGKSILLTSAESNSDQPGDFLVLVGLAQTVKIGSSAVKDKDWLQDGTFTIPNFSAYRSLSDANKLKYQRAMVDAGFGYRALSGTSGSYKPDFHYFLKLPAAASGSIMNPSESDLSAGTTRLKKFYPGYDKITATQKAVVWLRKNASGKWYVERLDYVD